MTIYHNIECALCRRCHVTFKRNSIRSLVQHGSRALPAADVVLASLERRGLTAEVAAAWLGSPAGVDLVALLLALGGPAATPPAAGAEDPGCSCSSCMRHSSWQKVLTTDSSYCWCPPVVDIGLSARRVKHLKLSYCWSCFHMISSISQSMCQTERRRLRGCKCTITMKRLQNWEVFALPAAVLVCCQMKGNVVLLPANWATAYGANAHAAAKSIDRLCILARRATCFVVVVLEYCSG